MRLSLYAPLCGLYMKGDEHALSDDTRILSSSGPVLGFECLEECASTLEKRDLARVPLWLHVDWDSESKLSSAEIVNLALLSMWLAKPTKMVITHRFEMESNAESAADGRAWRLLDRFSYVHGDVYPALASNDLELAGSLYMSLRDATAKEGRLASAVSMTITGCWGHRWHVAHMCRAAAAEALLTYEQRHGTTKRLAKTFACLVETEEPARSFAYKEFMAAYEVRSEIVHGQLHDRDSEENIARLAQMQILLRRLWCKVLLDPDAMTALDGTDAERRSFFSPLSRGFHPPN